MRAKWLPRLDNEEADALTNMDVRHFDPAKRIVVELKDLGFQVMPLLFEFGETYLAEREAAKSKAKLQKDPARGGGPLAGTKRRKVGESLRERDPWL